MSAVESVDFDDFSQQMLKKAILIFCQRFLYFSVVDDEEVQSCWVIFHLIIVESKTLLEDQSLLLGRRCAPHEMWTLIMINSRSRLCIYFVIIWLIRKRLVIWNEAEEIKYYKQHPGSSDHDHLCHYRWMRMYGAFKQFYNFSYTSFCFYKWLLLLILNI